MISINSLTKETKQNFNLFTKEDWQKSKDNHSEIAKFFSAEKNEFFVQISKEKVDFFIGFGEKSEDISVFSTVAQKFSNQYKNQFESLPTAVIGNIGKDEFSSFAEGLFLGTYSYPFDKDHPFWKQGFEIQSDQLNQNEALKLAEEIESICYGRFAGMEWMNKPANQKTAKLLSFFIAEECRKLNIKYKVLNRIECNKEGLGAYLAVNSGSAQDAAFTILEYDCGDKNAKTIGLVGKCVLFDSGGVSVKPSANMHHMKSDMGGAAAVIGALFAISKMKKPVNIVAVLPVTDNVISAESYLPSDVVRAYNGKTIEVLNTDAEGRLTLADGLAYLTKNYKTDVLIDLATLTGSAVRMFGNTCAPYFSNHPNLKNHFENSAQRSGEKLWNMPLWDVWLDEIQSDVADFKNISNHPYGDCIIAAKFLEQFTNQHPNWAHIDVAGTAFDKVNYAKESAATGYGVKLLFDFINNYIEK